MKIHSAMFAIALCAACFAIPARAQPAPQIPQPRYELACRGQFGPNATHADLVKAYGAKNVTVEEVARAEGEVVVASVVFAKDPARRLEVEWFDEEKKARPAIITVFGEKNRWIGPFGIRNGMTIARIEQIAGKPFRINGFGFDVAGKGHFEGTKLEKLHDLMVGQNAIAFGGESVVNVAREIVELVTKYPGIELKGAILDGELFVGEEGVKRLSKFPTRDEAIAKDVALILGPGRRLMASVKGPGATLAGIVKSIEAKLEKGEAIAKVG